MRLYDTILGLTSIATCCIGNAFAEEPSHFRDYKSSEVHVIGVGALPEQRLYKNQVKDWAKLVASLKTESGDAFRIANKLSAKARGSSMSDAILGDPSSGVTNQARTDLLDGLCEIVEGPRFYNVPSFTNAKHSSHIAEMLKQRTELSLIQTRHLNREYLSFATNGSISPTSIDYHSTEVRITGNSDIILVLCSSNACRWRVVVEKGSKVRGCILVGYYTQEITDDQIPVIYRAHHDRHGEETAVKALHAYSRTHRNYDGLLKMIKEVTGREPSSFQGDYEASKKGYTVKPSSK